MELSETVSYSAQCKRHRGLGHLKRAPAIVGQNRHKRFSCTPLYWSRVGSRDPISVRFFRVRHVGVHPWDLGRRFIAIFSTILKAPEASSSRLERGHFGSLLLFFSFVKLPKPSDLNEATGRPRVRGGRRPGLETKSKPGRCGWAIKNYNP